MHALGRGGARGVHGLMGFFDPIHYSGSKKIQLNPTQLTWLGWVGLNSWIEHFFYYYYY